jgi:hypothetical protein
MAYRKLSTLCIRGCGRERRPGQRECKVCHAEGMRISRQNRASEIDRLKSELARLRDENQQLRREIEARV